MSKEKKSKVMDVISWVVFILALGLLAYRVKDCKEKEAEREVEAQKIKSEAEAKAKGRLDRCLGTVSESDKTECVKCTCDRCLAEWEDCYNDTKCRGMKLGDQGTDKADAQSNAQLRLKARTECMIRQCFTQCVGKAAPKASE